MANTSGWTVESIGQLPSSIPNLLRREAPLKIYDVKRAGSLPLSCASSVARLPASALVKFGGPRDASLFFPPGDGFGATLGAYTATPVVCRALRACIVDAAAFGALHGKDPKKRWWSVASLRFAVNLASCYSWESDADVGKLPGCRAVMHVVKDVHEYLEENDISCSRLLDQKDRRSVAASKSAWHASAASPLSEALFKDMASNVWSFCHMPCQPGVSTDSMLHKSHVDAYGGVEVRSASTPPVIRRYVKVRVLLADGHPVDHVMTEYVASQSGQKLVVTNATRAVLGGWLAD